VYKRGYTYEQFLLLDNKMEKGSRQLLVCVGWLIYHTKLIDKCMKQYLKSISNIDQVCLMFIEKFLFLISQMNDDDQCDPIKQIKETLRSNIKIRSRLQNIEHENLQENHHMSSFERQLCQYPHLISQVI
jgi:hypothetical protein